MTTSKHSRGPLARRVTMAVAAIAAVAMAAVPVASANPKAAQTGPMSVEQVLERDGQALRDTGLLDLDVPQQATVLTEDEFASTDTNSALIRLDNNKISFMVKGEDGTPQEFLPMAAETGFWDSRSCGGVYEKRGDKLFSCVTAKQSPFYKNGDYEAGMRELFRQMKENYHLNTVQITVNWAEWDRTIDPENPTFDFTAMDDLAQWAGEAGLKVFWVLFFHIQQNMPAYDEGFNVNSTTEPGKPNEDAGYTQKKSVYNLADEGGYSYGVQWDASRRNTKDFGKNADSAVPEMYPEYWQPTIHRQLMTALRTIAKHYRSSDTVIGYQVGNEEGLCGANDYNYYDNPSTANPYYGAMFELWKDKTGKADKVTFRKELGLAVWQSMVAAMRAEDPYKVLTTNFQSSDVDKTPTAPRNSGGQDLDFYRDAGLDLIAPMYYGGTESIRGNVDKFYGSSDSDLSTVAQELPGLFPSEIGIGWDRGPNTQSDILDTFARGGVGFGLYSFGEMEALANAMKKTVRSLMEISTAYGHELWSGQPVSAASTDNIHMTTTDDVMTLTTLETADPDVAVGLLWHDYGNSKGTAKERPVSLTVRESGTYRIEAMVNENTDHARTVAATEVTAQAGEPVAFHGITMDGTSSAFLRVSKVG